MPVNRHIEIDYTAPDRATADEFENAVAELPHVVWGERLDNQAVGCGPGPDS